jgi:hypothetical protein
MGVFRPRLAPKGLTHFSNVKICVESETKRLMCRKWGEIGVSQGFLLTPLLFLAFFSKIIFVDQLLILLIVP